MSTVLVRSTSRPGKYSTVPTRLDCSVCPSAGGWKARASAIGKIQAPSSTSLLSPSDEIGQRCSDDQNDNMDASVPRISTIKKLHLTYAPQVARPPRHTQPILRRTIPTRPFVDVRGDQHDTIGLCMNA